MRFIFLSPFLPLPFFLPLAAVHRPNGSARFDMIQFSLCTYLFFYTPFSISACVHLAMMHFFPSLFFAAYSFLFGATGHGHSWSRRHSGEFNIMNERCFIHRSSRRFIHWFLLFTGLYILFGINFNISRTRVSEANVPTHPKTSFVHRLQTEHKERRTHMYNATAHNWGCVLYFTVAFVVRLCTLSKSIWPISHVHFFF